MKRKADCPSDRIKNENVNIQLQITLEQIQAIQHHYSSDISEIEKYYADESHELCNYILDILKQKIVSANTTTERMIECMKDKRQKT